MSGRIVMYKSTDPHECDYRYLAVRFENGAPVASAGSPTADGALKKLNGADQPPEPAEDADVGIVI